MFRIVKFTIFIILVYTIMSRSFLGGFPVNTSKNDKNPIQVADKLFLVLEALATHGPVSLTDLSKSLNLNKTTVHRVLNSLIYMGYVRQDTITSHYSLTLKIWEIANQLINRLDIVSEVRPHLRELAAITGETVHLVQLDGIHAVYIEKVESENSVRLVSMVGKSIPLYCSGVGKALLADMPDETIRQIWNQSDRKKLTDHTITDFTAFMEEIQVTRIRGYAMDNEENELGMRCIAASLKEPDGISRYAFSVSAPIHRMDEEHMKKIASYALSMKAKLTISL